MISFIENNNGELEFAGIGSGKLSRRQLKKMSIILDEFVNDLTDNEIEEYNSKVKDKFVGNKKKGFIYILKSLDLYKIGVTTNFNKRFKQYNTQNPHGIELIKKEKVNDIFKIENIIKRDYKENVKVGREWMKLSNDELKDIKYTIDFYAERI